MWLTLIKFFIDKLLYILLFSLIGFVGLFDEFIGGDNFADEGRNLINSGLVDLVNMLLIVSKQRAKNHEDWAGIFVKFSTNPDSI